MKRRAPALGLVAVSLVFLYAPTVMWLFERWTMSVWHNIHGMFVPPVVAYLVWLELRHTRELPPSASPLGFALLVPALLILALDAGMHTQLLSAFSIVLLVPGLSLLFLGVERTRRIAFPLVFLLFMLPIPLSFTERIHLTLRENLHRRLEARLIELARLPGLHGAHDDLFSRGLPRGGGCLQRVLHALRIDGGRLSSSPT